MNTLDAKPPVQPASIDAGGGGTSLSLLGMTSELRDFWQKLRRRYMTVLIVAIVVIASAMVYLSQATPRYTARAVVMLDARESTTVDSRACCPDWAATR